MNLPRAPQGASGFGAGVLAVLDYLDAIYKNVFHPSGVLLRLLKGGAIGNRRGIECDDVGEHALFNETAMVQSEVCGWQAAQSPDRLGHGNHFFVAHVLAENARERSISARMRIRF